MFVADAFVLMLIFLPKKASGLVEAPYHSAEKYKKSAVQFEEDVMLGLGKQQTKQTKQTKQTTCRNMISILQAF